VIPVEQRPSAVATEGLHVLFEVIGRPSDRLEGASGPEPTGRVFDTLTAMRLLGPCERWPVSMADAADALLNLKVPKGLGASDWSGDLDRY
jgi:hypothetical protein